MLHIKRVINTRHCRVPLLFLCPECSESHLHGNRRNGRLDLGEGGPSSSLLGSYAGGGVLALTALSYVGGASSSTPSVTARLECIGRLAEKSGSPAGPLLPPEIVCEAAAPASSCLAHKLTAGVAPEAATELSAAALRLSSCAIRRASSALLTCASPWSGSVEEAVLSSEFLLRRTNCVIHRSRSISSMTRKRTHSLLLSSSGSMSRMRSWLAARWRRAMESGRFVCASTCRAPNPPFLIAGVLYIAGLLTVGCAGMVARDVIGLEYECSCAAFADFSWSHDLGSGVVCKPSSLRVG